MRNIYLLIAIAILRNTLFVLPVLVLYTMTYKGLTVAQFMLAEAIFAFALMVFEIPSGWLSDMWKRKYVIVLGALIDAIGIVILAFAPGFEMWVLGQVVSAIGISLVSGTDTSLLYDTVNHRHDRDALYKRMTGRMVGLGLLSTAVATVIGGIMYTYNPHLPILLSAATCALAAIPALMLREPKRHKRAVKGHPLQDMLNSVRYALTHREIACIILFIGIMFALTKTGVWLQQPYYASLNINPQWFGWLVAGGLFLGWLGGELSHKIEQHLSLKWLVIGGFYLLPVVVFFTAGFWAGGIGIALLMSCSGLFGIARPILTHAIHSRLCEKWAPRRATISSTAMLAPQLMFFVVAPLVGTTSDNAGVQSAMLVIGLLCFVGLGAATFCLKHHKVI